MGYQQNFAELTHNIETKVMPAILYYAEELKLTNDVLSIHRDNSMAFGMTHYDTKTGPQFYCCNMGGFVYTPAANYAEIHQHDLKRFRVLINRCDLLKKQYEEVIHLIDECEKLDIKIATRKILFEKCKP